MVKVSRNRRQVRSGWNREKAQSVIEYALLIAVVAMAFAAMQVYGQRAVNANIKLIQDRVNTGP